MNESAHQPAGDLLVHGTFALRRALDRLAHPTRPPARPDPSPSQGEGRGGGPLEKKPRQITPNHLASV